MQISSLIKYYIKMKIPVVIVLFVTILGVAVNIIHKNYDCVLKYNFSLQDVHSQEECGKKPTVVRHLLINF